MFHSTENVRVLFQCFFRKTNCKRTWNQNKKRNEKAFFQKEYIYIYVRITIVSSLHIKAVFFLHFIIKRVNVIYAAYFLRYRINIWKKKIRSVSSHSLFECLRTWPAIGTSPSVFCHQIRYTRRKLHFGNSFGQSIL